MSIVDSDQCWIDRNFPLIKDYENPIWDEHYVPLQYMNLINAENVPTIRLKTRYDLPVKKDEKLFTTDI